jgi:hypothetical protein
MTSVQIRRPSAVKQIDERSAGQFLRSVFDNESGVFNPAVVENDRRHALAVLEYALQNEALKKDAKEIILRADFRAAAFSLDPALNQRLHKLATDQGLQLPTLAA